MRRAAAALALALAGAAPVAADDAASRRVQLEDELLGWCWGRDLWPAASAVERAAAPRACRDAASMWAETLAAVIARDGAGTEDGTRSIAAYVAACMAMNDVRAGARTESGHCSTRDRRMTGDTGAPELFVPDDDDDDARDAATLAAEERLAALVPDGTPREAAREALEALGFACDADATAIVCLFSHRELAYVAREATLFAGVFWNLELPLDGADRVAGRYLGVTLVHP